jgi:hypothetical protein
MARSTVPGDLSFSVYDRACGLHLDPSFHASFQGKVYEFRKTSSAIDKDHVIVGRRSLVASYSCPRVVFGLTSEAGIFMVQLARC